MFFIANITILEISDSNFFGLAAKLSWKYLILVKTNTKFETHMDRRDFLKKSAVLTAAATVPGMAFAGERQHIQGNGTSQEGQHIHGNNTAGEASEGDGTERKLIDTAPMLHN